MANNSVPTIGAQTGWSNALALKKGPLSLDPNVVSYISSKDAMIIQLNGLAAGYYNYGRLSNMTENDMIFALRNFYDGANI